MKNLLSTITAFLILFISASNGAAKEPYKYRLPAVAGTFYPADKHTLIKMIDGFLSAAKPAKQQGKVRALIAPHAGYVYSGHVAAQAYKTLVGRDVNRVIVISPSHVEYFKGAAIYDGKGYKTPLGKIDVDRSFAENLAAASPFIKLSGRGHEPHSSGRSEHALEVQLPFLQRVCGNFELVPVVMGDQDYETCRALGRAIAQTMKDENTIIVASSDLSHFHDYKDAAKRDRKVIDTICDRDYFNLSRNLSSRRWEACGGGPIVSTMIAAEQLGAQRIKLLKYANSGDVPRGDRSRVVGYAALSFSIPQTAQSAAEKDFRLNTKDQQRLLEIARKSVEKIVKQGERYDPPIPAAKELLAERGVFVTLKIAGQLRGCIGYTSPLKALYLIVRDAAIQAATGDPRFRAVSADELALLEYEISVLSPFRRVLDNDKIDVGKHGLLIKKGPSSGLLLPQVAFEQKWDRQTFLEHTCLKAGLPKNAWQDEDCDIFRFSAFVFGQPH